MAPETLGDRSRPVPANLGWRPGYGTPREGCRSEDMRGASRPPTRRRSSGVASFVHWAIPHVGRQRPCRSDLVALYVRRVPRVNQSQLSTRCRGVHGVDMSEDTSTRVGRYRDARDSRSSLETSASSVSLAASTHSSEHGAVVIVLNTVRRQRIRRRVLLIWCRIAQTRRLTRHAAYGWGNVCPVLSVTADRASQEAQSGGRSTVLQTHPDGRLRHCDPMSGPAWPSMLRTWWRIESIWLDRNKRAAVLRAAAVLDRTCGRRPCAVARVRRRQASTRHSPSVSRAPLLGGC